MASYEDTPLLPDKERTLPWFQLSILAFVQIAEPITLYITQAFTNRLEGDEARAVHHVGLIECAFFVINAFTAFQWCRWSDRVGRKPVLLVGLFGLTLSMIILGLSNSCWGLLASRCLAGLLNANIGVIKSVVGELTDETDIVQVMALMPITWSIGTTVGYIFVGADPLVTIFGQSKPWVEYPYVFPCFVAAGYCAFGFILTLVCLKETFKARHVAVSGSPTFVDENMPFIEVQSRSLSLTQLLSYPRVVTAILNYAFFAFLDTSFRALQPLIYTTGVPSGGLGLPLSFVGIALIASGLASGLLQIFTFVHIYDWLGPRPVFRLSVWTYLPIFVLFLLMNLSALHEGVNLLTWIELALQISLYVLIDMGFCTINIYIRASAPDNQSLGVTNGLAQTCVSIMRALGPAVSTSLFAISLRQNLLSGHLVYVVLAAATVLTVFVTYSLPEDIWQYEPTESDAFSTIFTNAAVFITDTENSLDDKDTQYTLFLPKFLRGFGWTSFADSRSRTAAYTEIDEPLPSPPRREFRNRAAMKTIRSHPDLFEVSTPINVENLESLLTSHPNQIFVRSVVRSLREGCWPWANTRQKDYPVTWDHSFAPPPSDTERTFLHDQRDTEVEKNRFSPAFGPDLLPGMYSTPIFAVPKPHSDDLRLISHQSAGSFSQNSMIDQEQTRGPRVDNLQQFIPALLRYRRQNPNKRLVVWKCDVAEAFRAIPMHPLWQLKQVVTTNLPTETEHHSGVSVGPLQRNVDQRACFGSRSSPRLWASVMGLVIWIATFVEFLTDIFCYVDDTFGWEEEGNLVYYAPYNEKFPRKQAKLLELWDHLGIPHKQRKQVWGPTLIILGFLVDPNAMTATMPEDSKASLISTVNVFIHSRRRTLHDFQILTGWINWSLNVFPLMRPCLSNIHAKMAGKSHPNAMISVNKAIKEDLFWFVDHVQKSDGISFFEAVDWNPYKEHNLTICCSATKLGMGFWTPDSEPPAGFFSPIPPRLPKDTIFFLEALCVLSAIHWYCHIMRQDSSLTGRLRLTVFTDSMKTVQIFDSLQTEPAYNLILRSAVDVTRVNNVDIRVLHIEGRDNAVANAISRRNFTSLPSLVPDLVLDDFHPPQDVLRTT